MIKEHFSMSFKNLKRRKLRSWLTVFGIIISIATIFILISVSLGLNSAIKEQFRQLGTDKFFIMPRGQLAGPGTAGAAALTSDDINVIRGIAGVKDYVYASVSPIKIEFAGQARFANVIGVPIRNSRLFFESGFINVDEGRLPSSDGTREVIVGSQYKLNGVFRQPVKAGSTIQLNGVDFKVKAVLKPIGSPTDDRQLYMSMEDFEDLFPAKEDNYDEIIVQTDSEDNVNEIAERVDKQLMRSRGVTDKTKDFTIQTPEQLLETFGNILNILTAFLLAVAGISLVVGAIGITNTMYTAVLERTKEIGVMKAVGARNSDIVSLFTIESGLLGLVGGIGGVVLGFITAKIIEFIVVRQFAISFLQISTPFYLFAACLLFSFLVGAVSGVVPAYRASNIRPVEALRYE